MTNLMDKANLHGLMVITMKELSSLEKETVKAKELTAMDQNILDNMLMINLMDLVIILMLKEIIENKLNMGNARLSGAFSYIKHI